MAERTASAPRRPHPRHPRRAAREGSARPASRLRDDHRRAGHGRPAARLRVLHGARHRPRSAISSAEALKSATGMLRTEVGKHLNVRLTPTLEFIPDAIPENAAHIEDLLREARERDQAVAGLASSATYAGDADPVRQAAGPRGRRGRRRRARSAGRGRGRRRGLIRRNPVDAPACARHHAPDATGRRGEPL